MVGVELHPKEIRVVHVKYKGNVPQIVGAAYCPMPMDSMARGQLVNAGSVSVALHKLLENMGLKGAIPTAIAGPSVGTILRRLSVPPAPDADLRAMVGGEVSHYQIMRTEGAFDFVRMESPSTESGDGMTAIMVAACEEPIISGIKALADQTHLDIISFEPLHFAMCRLAAASAGANATMFAVMLGDTHTDLALIHAGKLWFYRRLDLGADALRAGAYVNAESLGESGNAPLAARHLELGPAVDIATEIRRSIEYVEREFIGIPRLEDLHVVVNEPDLHVLGEFLTSHMEMNCRSVYPDAIGVAQEISVGFADSDSLRYVTAAGLAIRDAGPLVAGSPTVDLFSDLRESLILHGKKRNIVGSLVTSVVALAFGAIAFQLYTNQINAVKVDTKEAIARAERINEEASLQREQRALKAQQFQLLRREGVPVTVLLDYLQAGIRPGVGLSNVTIDPTLGVTISGDSANEAALINTVTALQRVPVLQGVSIQSFNREQRDRKEGIIFTLSSKTLTLESVQMPGDAPQKEPAPAAPQTTPTATTEVKQ